MSDEAKQYVDSPTLQAEACGWVADAFYVPLHVVVAMPPGKVMDIVERQYEGGIAAFVKASAELVA